MVSFFPVSFLYNLFYRPHYPAQKYWLTLLSIAEVPNWSFKDGYSLQICFIKTPQCSEHTCVASRFPSVAERILHSITPGGTVHLAYPRIVQGTTCTISPTLPGGSAEAYKHLRFYSVVYTIWEKNPNILSYPVHYDD